MKTCAGIQVWPVSEPMVYITSDFRDLPHRSDPRPLVQPQWFRSTPRSYDNLRPPTYDVTGPFGLAGLA